MAPVTTLINVSVTKSVFAAAYAGYAGPNPPTQVEIRPGTSYGPTSPTYTNWYIYTEATSSAGPDAKPIWSGQLSPGYTATINPDDGQVAVGSLPVQSQTGDILAAQVMGNGSYSCYVGNKAAVPVALPMVVNPGTPYIIFRLLPVPGTTLEFDVGMTVIGPEIFIGRPVDNENIKAYAKPGHKLTSVMVTNPAPGIWTANLNSGATDDYVVLATTGPAERGHNYSHDAIDNATPICEQVLSRLLPDEHGVPISRSLPAEVPGACFVCLVEWYVLGAVVIGFTATEFEGLTLASWIVKRAAIAFGVTELVAKQAFDAIAPEATNPFAWPKIWCKYIGMCSK